MSEPATRSMEPDRPGSPEMGRGFRPLFVLPVALFLVLAALLLARLWAGDPSRVPSALIGRPVPAFALAPLPGLAAKGEPVPGLSDADLRNGQVTIVNVWASWCGPCRQEHPALAALAKDPGFRVVGINYKDNPENARRFLGALGNPFAAVGVDPNGRAAIDWGVYGVPETFVVGPDGTVRHKHVGPILPDQVASFAAKARPSR